MTDVGPETGTIGELKVHKTGTHLDASATEKQTKHTCTECFHHVI